MHIILRFRRYGKIRLNPPYGNVPKSGNYLKLMSSLRVQELQDLGFLARLVDEGGDLLPDLGVVLAREFIIAVK